MSYVDSSVNMADASGEEFPEFAHDPANTAVYGVMLTRLKAFLCGEIKNIAAGVNTGNGELLWVEALKPSAAGVGFSVEFTSSTGFDLKDPGASIISSHVLAAPNGGNRFCQVDDPVNGFSFYLVEGSTDFAIGDSFTFDVAVSGITPSVQSYEVISDSAKGYGATHSMTLLLNDLFVAGQGAYDQAHGAVMVSNLVIRGQSNLNHGWYADFYSATHYALKDAAGGVLATGGVIGTPFFYSSEGGALEITLDRFNLSTPVIGNSGGNSNGIPPSTYGTGDRTNVKITPKYDQAAESASRVNRIIVLKSTGLSQTDSIYYTLSQRVKGNQSGFSLEVRVGPEYNPEQSPFSQSFQSPPTRLKHSQGYEIPYTIIADGRHFYLLYRLVQGQPDFQAMGAGFFLPHSQPIDYAWPGFVGANLASELYLATVSSLPSGGSRESAFFSPCHTNTSSNLYVRLPTGVWIRGGNYFSTSYPIQDLNSESMGNAAGAGNAVFTTPWVFSGAQSGREMKMSSVAFGPNNLRVPIPAIISVSTPVLTGVLGEFPDLFFIGDPGAGDISGDIIQAGGVDHLLWKPTAVPANDAAISATFAKV